MFNLSNILEDKFCILGTLSHPKCPLQVVCFDTSARSIFFGLGGSSGDGLSYYIFTSNCKRYIKYKYFSGLETVFKPSTSFLRKAINKWLKCSRTSSESDRRLACFPKMQMLSSKMLEEFTINRVFSVPIIKFWNENIS